MKSFISVEIYVHDVQATASFFEKHFGATQEYGDDNYALIWLGRTRISLNELKVNEFSPPNPILNENALEHLGSGLEIVIAVDNIDQVFSKLQSEAVASLTAITSQPWGLRDFRFLLPDGYYIRVTEPDQGIAKVWR